MKAPEFWYHTSGRDAAPVIKSLLWPFSLLYHWIVQKKLKKTTPHQADMPVVCVGNVVLGGSGKTPIVRALSTMLATELGHHPCILMRGYKGTFSGPLWVHAGKHSAKEVGDEALLLLHPEKQTKKYTHQAVCVSKNRKEGALKISTWNNENASKSNKAFTLIIMDDGLQNPDLEKNLSFLVLDAQTGIGNGQIFPAGPLRESLAHALTRSHAIILIVTDFSYKVDFLENMDPALQAKMKALPILKAKLVPQHYIPAEKAIQSKQNQEDDSLKHWLAFCGIGRPEKFFTTARNAGFSLCDLYSFPDHHMYTEKDMKKLYRLAKQNQAHLLTTEKDWVRLPPKHQKKIAFLPISVVFEKKELLQKILKNTFISFSKKTGSF